MKWCGCWLIEFVGTVRKSQRSMRRCAENSMNKSGSGIGKLSSGTSGREEEEGELEIPLGFLVLAITYTAFFASDCNI